MAATLLDDGVEALVEAVLESDPERVYVINPSDGTIRELVELLAADQPSSEVRLLASTTALKSVLGEFVIASMAADLRSADVLDLRTLNGQTENSAMVGSACALALLRIGGRTAGLATDDEPFIDELRDVYAAQWEAAERFPLRTPPLSEVRHTLARDIGDPIESDFSAVLASLESLNGDGRLLDEVTISLLVAAKHEQLLYDISKWGEDVGIASKATFSRTKTDLEKSGLLETEKVPIDVGRPRLRLKLGTPALQDASADELAGVAVELLG